MLVDKVFLPLIVGILIALFSLLLPSKKLKKPRVRWLTGVLLFILAGGAVYSLVPKHTEKIDLGITGTVVEETTEASISGASVSLSGRSETTISESNGNFRLKLKSDVSVPEFISLRVEKFGYITRVEGVKPGMHGLIVQLSRVP